MLGLISGVRHASPEVLVVLGKVRPKGWTAKIQEITHNKKLL